MDKKFLVYDPVVFVIGNDYDIMFYTEKKGAAAVRVGGKMYWDSTNGLIKSEDNIHSVRIPQELLNEAGEYTVIYSHYPHREPYFPSHTEPEEVTYTFRAPREDDGLQIYWLSDTHEKYESPSRTGQFFGDALDLLVLGGDIGESLSVDHILNVYRVAERVTHGARPVLYVRGNHDLRGILGEIMPKYVATDKGNTYFTFRLGSLWGIVLDCGEDKRDDSTEYGGTADFNTFRAEQTEFVRRVIKNADGEYLSSGVKYKMAFCHLPFTDYAPNDPQFDQSWAKEYYEAWCEGLNEMGIDLMMTGHMHSCYTREPAEQTALNTVPAFPLVVSCTPNDHPFTKSELSEDEFTGSAIEINDGTFNLKYTNSKRESVFEKEIK